MHAAAYTLGFMFVLGLGTLAGTLFAHWYSRKYGTNGLFAQILPWLNLIGFLSPMAGMAASAASFVMAGKSENGMVYKVLGSVGLTICLLTFLASVALRFSS